MMKRTILAALVALLFSTGAVMAQTQVQAPAQTQDQQKPEPPKKAMPGFQRGTENLTCGEREARCYDARGLCERYCQPQQASKADPQATGECFSRCSRGVKQCLDKLPAECNVLSEKNSRPLPRIEGK